MVDEGGGVQDVTAERSQGLTVPSEGRNAPLHALRFSQVRKEPYTSVQCARLPRMIPDA